MQGEMSALSHPRPGPEAFLVQKEFQLLMLPAVLV